MKQVYIALGGNIGDVRKTFYEVIEEIQKSPHISQFHASSFYRTAPVSDIPQPDFLNAACAFQTTFSPHKLLYFLQEIEKKFGKVPKAKNAPRCIDIDILWYNGERIYDVDLEIPHPHWQERLFVLLPLSELVEELDGCSIKRRIEELQ
jgi:2-amino-4-hydroxy-6-hydroxymethyldihydropteridine diphosphokinase